MSAATFAGAVLLLLAPSLEAQSTQTTLVPTYTTASIANAATNLAAGFAPNSIISIYGANLAFDTAVTSFSGAFLPNSVSGVSVYFGSEPGSIFYISPGQVNVLIPTDLLPGPVNVRVVRQGTSGLPVPITLTATAPGLFQSGPNTVLATHADSSLITTSSPATAGEVIVVYALGLGPTIPSQTAGFAPAFAQPIVNLATLSVLLNGSSLPASSIQYAGVTPGLVGLYQVNVLLPTPLPANPELRVAIGSQISPPNQSLPTQ